MWCFFLLIYFILCTLFIIIIFFCFINFIVIKKNFIRLPLNNKKKLHKNNTTKIYIRIIQKLFKKCKKS